MNPAYTNFEHIASTKEAMSAQSCHILRKRATASKPEIAKDAGDAKEEGKRVPQGGVNKQIYLSHARVETTLEIPKDICCRHDGVSSRLFPPSYYVKVYEGRILYEITEKGHRNYSEKMNMRGKEKDRKREQREYILANIFSGFT